MIKVQCTNPDGGPSFQHVHEYDGHYSIQNKHSVSRHEAFVHTSDMYDIYWKQPKNYKKKIHTLRFTTL